MRVLFYTSVAIVALLAEQAASVALHRKDNYSDSLMLNQLSSDLEEAPDAAPPNED